MILFVCVCVCVCTCTCDKVPICGCQRTGLFVCLFVFRNRVSLCNPGCPGTHSLDQAGLKLSNLPASASQVLGLKTCATTAGRG